MKDEFRDESRESSVVALAFEKWLWEGTNEREWRRSLLARLLHMG